MSGGRYGKNGEVKRLRRLSPRGKIHRRLRRPSVPPSSSRDLPGRRPQQVSIRHARSSDAWFIHRLSEVAFQAYGSYGDIIRGWLDSGQAISLIAQICGRPAGFAMMERIPARSDPPRGAELLAIAVDPADRRRGAGRALLRRIETLVHGQGAERIWLHTATDNHSARNLFERSGYRSVRLKRAFYPNGQDALLMVKQLQNPPPES